MKQSNDWQAALGGLLDDLGGAPVSEENDACNVETEGKSTETARLDVIMEKKGRGGKTATIVTGFTVDDDEVARIASQLKTRLGAGGSSRGGEILIQGDRRKDVVAQLQKMGMKARII